MPRLAGVRERRHQPFWDSIVRTTGDPSPVINNPATLFGSANVGQLDKTNLQVAGQLAADQTYIVLAMRCYMYFRGTNRMANYFRTSSQLYFTLTVGDKPSFVAPAWYFPAGGGIDAGHDDGGSSGNNGMPTQEAFMKLAKPIPIPVRQNFTVEGRFFAMGSISAINLLNDGETDDEKCIAFYLDGVQTRDVQ